MEELMKDEQLKIPMSPFSAVIEGSNVALETLKGTIEVRKKNIKKGIEHLENAAKREWMMVYTEPRDWMLNPYNYLGNAYLQDKNYKKAEEAFRKDLQVNAKKCLGAGRSRKITEVARQEKRGCFGEQRIKGSFTQIRYIVQLKLSSF